MGRSYYVRLAILYSIKKEFNMEKLIFYFLINMLKISVSLPFFFVKRFYGIKILLKTRKISKQHCSIFVTSNSVITIIFIALGMELKIYLEYSRTNKTHFLINYVAE